MGIGRGDGAIFFAFCTIASRKIRLDTARANKRYFIPQTVRAAQVLDKTPDWRKIPPFCVDGFDS